MGCVDSIRFCRNLKWNSPSLTEKSTAKQVWSYKKCLQRDKDPTFFLYDLWALKNKKKRKGKRKRERVFWNKRKDVPLSCHRLFIWNKSEATNGERFLFRFFWNGNRKTGLARKLNTKTWLVSCACNNNILTLEFLDFLLPRSNKIFLFYFDKKKHKK